MSQDNSKCYAVSVTAKPKPNASGRYKSKSFKGIVFADSPSIAKEKAVEIILNSIKEPVLSREEITINSCNLFNDFLFHPKTKA